MTTSTKANIDDQTYRQRLSKQEQRIVNVAEDFTPAQASDWTSQPESQDAALNLLAAEASGGVVKEIKAVYDFSSDGGAVGDIDLGINIPDDAIVINVLQDVLVSPDSAGNTGTIKIKLPTDGDLTTNITADAGTSGLVDGTPDHTAANAVKATAERAVTAEIGTEALTAGKINVFIKYLRSD